MAGIVLRGFALAWVAFAGLLPNPAAAQSWPSKNISIIVPLAPGTGMDTLVRLYAEKLSQNLGKPVIVDNRPGAALMLGAAALAKSAPDGYTLGVSTSSAMAINPTLYKQINYDPEKDFIPVSLYVKSPFILVINPALTARNVPEFIKLAKESAAPFSFSTPGAGTAQHLSAEFMKQKFGVNITHVPYKSSPQSVTDIVAGHVTMAFAEAGLSLPLIRDGKLRALAVSSTTRNEVMRPSRTPNTMPQSLAKLLPVGRATPDHAPVATTSSALAASTCRGSHVLTSTASPILAKNRDTPSRPL